MSRLSSKLGMGMGGNWELINGKNGNEIKVSDGNGNGMGTGMKSLKWEGIGTKKICSRTSLPWTKR